MSISITSVESCKQRVGGRGDTHIHNEGDDGFGLTVTTMKLRLPSLPMKLPFSKDNSTRPRSWSSESFSSNDSYREDSLISSLHM